MSKKNKYTDSCRGGFGRYVLTVCMAACVAGPLSAVRLPAVVPDNVRMEWVDTIKEILLLLKLLESLGCENIQFSVGSTLLRS